MKVVAAVEVNPVSNALGLGSKALEDLCGESVLGRALRRAGKVRGVDGVVVITSPEHADRVRGAGIPGEVKVIATELRDIAKRAAFRRARRWSLACWRGGIGNASYFDEQGSPLNLMKVLEETKADSVLWVPEAGPLFDPKIASGMMEQHEKHLAAIGFTFSQAPPGLAGAVYHKGFLAWAIQTGGGLGDWFRFKPSQPQRDLAEFVCHYELPEAVRFGPFRFTADGRWGLEMLREFWRRVPEAEDADAAAAVRAMWEHPELRAGKFPKEVEIEITNRCNLKCNFCPRERRRAEERDMEMGLFREIVGELDEYDDVRVTLSGLGEPLLHPELPAMVRAAKEAGVFGVHVETNGVLMEGKSLDELLDAGPDAVSVSLDADSAGTFESLKGADAFERVKGNLEKLMSLAKEGAGPVVCASMVKLAENEGEMESFYDRWESLGCWPVIRGYNDFAGQLPQRNPLPMRLAERIPCRKLDDEMVITADGRVPYCSQDFECGEVVGEARVAEAWNSDKMWRLRREHQKREYGSFPLCERCVDWYYL